MEQRKIAEEGIILPVVLAIVFVIGLLQLRVEQRLFIYSKSSALKSESLRAELTARNSALLAAAGGTAGPAALSTIRLAAQPVRLEAVTASTKSGSAAGKAAAFILMPAAANGFLPDWGELKKINGEKLCPFDYSSRTGFLSARFCTALPERGIFLQGNFVAKEPVRLRTTAERVVIASTGSLEFAGGIELDRSTKGSGAMPRLELIALGPIKIKSITGKASEEDPVQLLIHSSLGEIVIEKSSGIDLCLDPKLSKTGAGVSAVTEISVRVTVETPLGTTAGKHSLPAGQNGCGYLRTGPGWVKRRLVGLGPAE